MYKNFKFLFLVGLFIPTNDIFCLTNDTTIYKLLVPDRLFDGIETHQAWVVLIKGNTIHSVGPIDEIQPPEFTQRIDLPGTTLLPGLIEGHAHLLLHPYNETSWNDQVLRESIAERISRATVHARKTLEAGFTTVRDLGSEGAGYADVGLKESIAKGIIPGPRLLVAGPAIVATGSYGPKGYADQVEVPLGAEEADGHDNLVTVVRLDIPVMLTPIPEQTDPLKEVDRDKKRP